MAKGLSIKYIKGYKQEGDIKYPEYDYKTVTINHTKRYHNCLMLLAGLTGCARDLLDYLTENMDKDNMVANTKATREKFIETISNLTIKEIPPTNYKDDTVSKAFQRLADKGLLVSKGRSSYQVDPTFFMKNDDSRRSILLKLIFEEGSETKITRVC